VDLLDTGREAFRLLFTGDPDLWQIIAVSLRVSLAALTIIAPLAVACGYLLATARFPGRRVAVIVLQSLLSFPTVVVGLILYLLPIWSGPVTR